MQKNILVTGGAGFIGSHLVDKLIEDPQNRVYVLDDLSSGKKENLNKKAKSCGLVKLSCLDSLGTIGFDSIFHLAAVSRIQPSFANPQKTFETNVIGTQNILEFAKKHNCKVVFAGTSCMDSDYSTSPYATTKKIGEDLCLLYRLYGVKAGIARFYNVYGERCPSDSKYGTLLGIFENQYRQGLPLTITGDGSKRRDFIHVSDVVDALIKMEESIHLEKPFNLGTSRNFSILEVAKLFRGAEIQFLPGKKGEAEITLADNQETKDILGWEPKVKLEDYVDNFINN